MPSWPFVLRVPNSMLSHSLEQAGPLPGTKRRVLLHPLQQLIDLGGGRFESTGAAPRFVVRGARGGLPGGWVRIRFSIAEARPYASGTIRVTPEGDLPTISHPLPSLRDGHVDQYIRLPDRVAELCFDPMDQPGVSRSRIFASTGLPGSTCWRGRRFAIRAGFWRLPAMSHATASPQPNCAWRNG
jgi:hypothetical protein